MPTTTLTTTALGLITAKLHLEREASFHNHPVNLSSLPKRYILTQVIEALKGTIVNNV